MKRRSGSKRSRAAEVHNLSEKVMVLLLELSFSFFFFVAPILFVWGGVYFVYGFLIFDGFV